MNYWRRSWAWGWEGGKGTAEGGGRVIEEGLGAWRGGGGTVQAEGGVVEGGGGVVKSQEIEDFVSRLLACV